MEFKPPYIVKAGRYKHYNYFITYNDMWYCAYVEIPIHHPFYNVSYDDIPIDVHGGVTFAGNHRMCHDHYCIGWDYHHVGDYNPFFTTFFNEPVHHWTVNEIETECIDVINQLVKFDNKLIKIFYE